MQSVKSATDMLGQLRCRAVVQCPHHEALGDTVIFTVAVYSCELVYEHLSKPSDPISL